MQLLLNQRMPRVRQLVLKADLYNSDDRRVDQPPTYHLMAYRLPSMDELYVRDAYVLMEKPICFNLRQLHLSNSDFGTRLLSLPAFLDILRNCDRLEKLEVAKYIDYTAPGGPPFLSLCDHVHLQWISIQDEPEIVSKIYSRLVIPPQVDLQAIGEICLQAEHAATAILPRNRHTVWPLLRKATLVRVNDSEDDYGALEGRRNGRGVGVYLHRREEGPTLGISGRTEGVVFRTLLKQTAIFEGSPVDTLDLVGNVKTVPPELWYGTLDRFPDVEDLNIADIPCEDPEETLRRVIPMLYSPSSNQPGRVLCPQLDRLRLRGVIRNEYLLIELHQALSNRIRRGARVLSQLVLNLYSDMEDTWSAEELVRWHNVLGGVAKVVHLTVGNPDEWLGDAPWIDPNMPMN
ncbi:hypothetical protein BD413DRAFT_463647 [Trametes elegans]|nr:hypothetical protein BD413DRAFT_463647 [Trametes elegans]